MNLQFESGSSVDTESSFPTTIKWWFNPARFLDIDDLNEGRAAYLFFLDLLVNRPTEFRALCNLFLLARSGQQQLSFTRRQSEAIRLGLKALAQGQNPARFAANRMQVSESAVHRLWKRADAKMVTNDDIFPVLNRSSETKQWRPSEKEIRAQIAKTSRICAGCGSTIRDGRFALCFQCAGMYGRTREEWQQPRRKGEPAPAKWLLPEARRLDAETRRAAINEIYRHHQPDGQDFESLLETIAG